MMTYGDTNLGQHWPRWWLVAWRPQAITSTNADFSPKVVCGIHLRVFIWVNPQHVSRDYFLKLLQHPPGVNELSELSSCDKSRDNYTYIPSIISVWNTWHSITLSFTAISQACVTLAEVIRDFWVHTFIHIHTCIFIEHIEAQTRWLPFWQTTLSNAISSMKMY